MLRDSLMAATLAIVSIGDKTCHMKKSTISESHPVGEVDLTDIAWAIIGVDSGLRARPMEPKWATKFG